MIIIGVDFNPEFQQIAWVDTDTRELQEQRLQHREKAETFCRLAPMTHFSIGKPRVLASSIKLSTNFRPPANPATKAAAACTYPASGSCGRSKCSESPFQKRLHRSA